MRDNIEKMCKIIGISGCSGSGKSTIAHELCIKLKTDILYISADYYYKTVPENTDISNYDFDSPNAIDENLLYDHLYYFYNNCDIEISIPYYNFKNHKREKRLTVAINPKTIRFVILDGILIFSLPKIQKFFNIRIFIDTSLDLCFIRRMKRDIKERGRDLESVVNQWIKFVKPSYYKYILPYKEHSNIIISNDDRIIMESILDDLVKKDLQLN